MPKNLKPAKPAAKPATKPATKPGPLTVRIENGRLIIDAPLESPTPSASGKTMVVASSRGNLKTGLLIEGRELTIGFKAFYH